jgi:hypothetical protein
MPLPQLHSFALWLPKHAALVKSITVETGYLLPTDDVHGLPADSHVDEVQRVLLQALQLAGTKSAPPAAAPASATAAVSASVGGNTAAQQQQQQQQEGWRLASFSSDLPRAELLAALPAHNLTHLDIYAGSCSTRSGEGSNAIAASLARLTSLQHLELWIGTDGIPVSVSHSQVGWLRCTAQPVDSTNTAGMVGRNKAAAGTAAGTAAATAQAGCQHARRHSRLTAACA